MPDMASFVIASTACLVAVFVSTSGKVMPHTQPIVDAGLFVISGVMTCGEGRGYCLLGMDCTLDEEFLPDPQGHCKGLQNAFTPSAYFSCCKYKNLTGQDNFIYTMVDPAVSTLVNSYSDSTTEKMNVVHESLNNNENSNHNQDINTNDNFNNNNENFNNNFNDDFQGNTKKEPDPINNANILEEFNKHMENVKLKNEDKDKNSFTADTTAHKEHIVPVVSNVSINGEDSESEEDTNEEEEHEEEEEEEEEDEIDDEKTENNDIKTIHLGEYSGDRVEKETNEAEEDYDSNESDEKVEAVKEASKDKDHMKKVDLGQKVATQNVTADTVVDNVKQFLNKNKVKPKPTKMPKPTKTTSKPAVKINMIPNGDHKDQEKVSDMEAVKQQYPSQQQTTSEKLCMRKKNAPKCRTVWKFMHQQKTLCSGTMLDQIWMLTSATCLERLVQVGLQNVTLESHTDWRISNVVAHESFRSEYNHTHHDIGLVRLMAPIERSICVPCIPRLNQKFVGSECSAPFSSSSQRSGSALLCQGLSEAYHSHGDEFMSLACRNPTGTNHNISDWNSGNGIICRGYMAGLQTPVRTDQLVYLQINPYVKWIQDNMKSTGISQKFQLGTLGR